MRGLFLKKNFNSFSLSIDVKITMISGVVYLLRIFKMFHRLMNNPVFSDNWLHSVTRVYTVVLVLLNKL